eukprot:20314-Heterococcus_DN1.PRE.8
MYAPRAVRALQTSTAQRSQCCVGCAKKLALMLSSEKGRYLATRALRPYSGNHWQRYCKYNRCAFEGAGATTHGVITDTTSCTHYAPMSNEWAVQLVCDLHDSKR